MQFHTRNGGQVIDTEAPTQPNRARPVACGLALVAILFAEWHAIDWLSFNWISKLWSTL